MGSSMMLASFRATLMRNSKQASSPLQPLSPTSIFFSSLHARYHNYALSSAAVSALETPSQSCSWPEWSTFIDRLKSRGYLLPSSTSSFELTPSLSKDINVLKNACFSFARDRFDVFNSLSKDDVQALVEAGCPNINRKVVNSAKRLRAYTGLVEADVCGACVLRESCDRACITLKESESVARTVDIVRILLLYALKESVNSDGAKPAIGEQVQLSARRLLSELVELTEAPPEPGLAKPPGNESYKKKVSGDIAVKKNSKVPKDVDTVRGDWTCTKCSFLNFSRNSECLMCSEHAPDTQEAEMKKGDWMCPECNFMNFSRNSECLKCKAEGPKKVDMINVEMKKGDWNCPQCNYMNFSNNLKCHRCTESRPPRQLEPGEWECPSCDFVNFRRNFSCRKCQLERPKEKAHPSSNDHWRKSVDDQRRRPIDDQKRRPIDDQRRRPVDDQRRRPADERRRRPVDIDRSA